MTVLLVDTADPDTIVKALLLPAVRGFTTNPTLMARAANVEVLPIAEYIRRARVLCKIAVDMQPGECAHLMIQVVGSPPQMIEQSDLYIEAVKGNGSAKLWIKLPPTPDGIGCCRVLADRGCSTIVTAVYTPAQALVAMEAGASGIAVYLGRLIKFDEQWDASLRRIADIIKTAGKTLLLASLGTLETLERGLGYSHDLTVPPDILFQMLDSPYSADAMRTFDSSVIG